MSSSTIYEQARDSLQVLDRIASLSDGHDAVVKIAADNLARFRIWAGNIGAWQVDARSVDSRLREAPEIRARIGELLDEVQEDADLLASILLGQREDRSLTSPASLEPNADTDAVPAVNITMEAQGAAVRFIRVYAL